MGFSGQVYWSGLSFPSPGDLHNLGIEPWLPMLQANLENSTVATGLEKVSFHSNRQEGYAKESSTYCIVALLSHASHVMLKILQARLQQYVNHELPDVQAGFRKSRGTKDQISSICYRKRKRVSEKHLLLLY